MIDQFGRQIEYMRVSVTDRCNLRCVYCMPEAGVPFTPHSEILSFDEITKICELASGLGIKKIKLTGGEPLVRKGLSQLIAMLKALPDVEQVTLTTNGILLKEQMEGLVSAGLDAVNISIDTLDPERYRTLTRGGNIEDVLCGLKAALAYPNLHVKVNCVPFKIRTGHDINGNDINGNDINGNDINGNGGNGHDRNGHDRNDHEIYIASDQKYNEYIDLARLAKKHPVDVRFIEMMPIGLGKVYDGICGDEMQQALTKVFGEGETYDEKLGNGPAVYLSFPGFQGRVGFISAVSHKFCDGCNRVRLTSEGFLKPCLQYGTGTDLKRLLRSGASDEEMISQMMNTIYNKPASHEFQMACQNSTFETKEMSRIGG